MRILLTGANGFIGSHLVREIVNRYDWEILSLERLKPPSPLNRLADIPQNRILRFYHDFRAPLQESLLAEMGHVDYIVHLGAEVHAIRSLSDPRSFIQSNTVGVFNMLEAARKLKPKKFIYVSSAEVFGPAPEGVYHAEDAPLNPSNPYSAAKAGGEMLCKAYFKSFGVPVIITRGMNIFGEMQDITKYVPRAIKQGLAGGPIVNHSDRKNGWGSRQWMYVQDYIGALLKILESGNAGESYNIVGLEMSNFEIAHKIIDALGGNIGTKTVHPPDSHDVRYAIGPYNPWPWKDVIPHRINRTVHWYLNHREWLR